MKRQSVSSLISVYEIWLNTIHHNFYPLPPHKQQVITSSITLVNQHVIKLELMRQFHALDVARCDQDRKITSCFV